MTYQQDIQVTFTLPEGCSVDDCDIETTVHCLLPSGERVELDAWIESEDITEVEECKEVNNEVQ